MNFVLSKHLLLHLCSSFLFSCVDGCLLPVLYILLCDFAHMIPQWLCYAHSSIHAFLFSLSYFSSTFCSSTNTSLTHILSCSVEPIRFTCTNMPPTIYTDTDTWLIQSNLSLTDTNTCLRIITDIATNTVLKNHTDTYTYTHTHTIY